MKRKVITCDICGNVITADDVRFKFKKYENTYVNYDDFEFKKWRKLDMCQRCFDDFSRYIQQRCRPIPDEKVKRS